jgi:hypothetical protein
LSRMIFACARAPVRRAARGDAGRRPIAGEDGPIRGAAQERVGWLWDRSGCRVTVADAEREMLVEWRSLAGR